MADYPIKMIQDAVLAWYKRNGRHTLPWRNLEKTKVAIPYGVLVSEMMLQQTQVERVMPKFNAFISYFPTVQKLAAASPAKVIVLWSGLGYNRRATMLHRAAQELTAHYNGVLPPELTALEALPGIGPYTAGAILAFGYNLPAPVVDTNIERFYELLFWGYAKPSPKEVKAFVCRFIPEQHSRDWHAALMDVMTEVRRFKTPDIQQKELVARLDISPTWRLPKLSSQPLKRAKQSAFAKSKRYYRGQVVAYLRNQADHQATVTEIKQLVTSLSFPAEFSLHEVLEGLKKDKLIDFTGQLRGSTKINLSRG